MSKEPRQGQPQQVNINIELPPEQAEGTYSNLAIITHSPAEFVIDFTRILPGVPKARVYSRVIMAPQHAKSLLRALEENIRKYEAQYGEIKVHQQKGAPRQFGFQPPVPEDSK